MCGSERTRLGFGSRTTGAVGLIVVLFPFADPGPDGEQAGSLIHIQAILAEPTAERFDIAMVPGLIGRDAVYYDLLLAEGQEGVRNKFGAVVTTDGGGNAPEANDRSECSDDVSPGDRPCCDVCQRLTGLSISHGCDLEPAAVVQSTAPEIDVPTDLQGLRPDDRTSRLPNAIASPP